MNNELDTKDVKNIVNNLIAFIVDEGKSYVSEERKSEYVASYLHVLIKTVNQMDNDPKESLVENIASDIVRYIK